MSLTLYTGNNLHLLAEKYTKCVYQLPRAHSLENFLEPEIVAVQTQGIASWLKEYLASHTEIAMNLKTPFIRSAVESIVSVVDPERFRADMEIFRPERMVWQIFGWLSDVGNRQKLPENLQGYLANDPDHRKRFQFSEKLAGLYDQYQIYRMDIMGKWRDPEIYADPHEDNGWQCLLYREIFQNHSSIDVYMRKFLEGTFDPRSFSSHYSLFGVGALPPVFLDCFAHLSGMVDVNLFYVNPSEDFWEDLEPGKNHSFQEILGQEDSLNPILRANCQQGRSFYHELINIQDYIPVMDHDLQRPYINPGEVPTLLKILQQNIYKNEFLYNGSTVQIRSDDDSLIVNSCATRMRELEVLKDRLLKIMSEDPSVTPGDILVMMPDVNVYAAGIESVFGCGPLQNAYEITDRSLEGESSLAPAFMSLLTAARSSFEFNEITQLLEIVPIAEKYHIQPDDLNLMRTWLNASGVRWGIDHDTHKDISGADFEEYSWRSGLDRILCGYAVRMQDAEACINGEMFTYPLDAVEGTSAVMAGNCIQFVQDLFDLHQKLCGKNTPAAWCDLLQDAVLKFFEINEDLKEEYQVLISELVKLRDSSLICTEEVSFSIISDLLKTLNSSISANRPFLNGKIIFCSMVPMRSIPMKVIAVLGMNNQEFPRRNTEPGFNLIAADIRKTDRSRLWEDRYLFLEAILSAQRNLIFSYVGQNAKNGKACTPAVPLMELESYLSEICLIGEEKCNIETVQKLQPFDFAYFNRSDSRLFSYSESALRASQALAEYLKSGEKSEQDIPYLSLVKKTLDPGKYHPEKNITVSSLVSFFKRPAAFYFKQLASVDFTESEQPVYPDSEPFALDNLENYSLKQKILDRLPECRDEKLIRKYIDLSEHLPLYVLGDQIFHTTCKDIEAAYDLKTGFVSETVSVPLNSLLNGYQLSGSVDMNAAENKAAFLFPSNSLSGKTLLLPYLTHLLACSCGIPLDMKIYSAGGQSKEFMPVKQEFAIEVIDGILGLMEKGYLQPLLFLPESSFNMYSMSEGKDGHSFLITCLDKSFTGPGEYDSHPELQKLLQLQDFKNEEVYQTFMTETNLFWCGVEKKNDSKKK